MLKLFFVSAAVLLFSGGLAFSAPLLSVTKNSGFVMPEYSYHIDCSINSANTVMNIRLGEHGRPFTRISRTRYTRSVNNSMHVQNLIAAAALGRLVIYPGPSDMPTASYYGLLGSRRITLLNDQSIGHIRNTAPGVNALLQLADLNCPVPRQ